VTDRKTLDQMTSNDLDELYNRLATEEADNEKLRRWLLRCSHRERAEQAEQERDGAYRERNRTVALAAAGLAETVVIAPAPDVDEPGWQILYASLNGRQASWHFGPRDADLIAHFEHVPADDPRARWDGHTTEEKYAGIAAWTVELAQRCGPACAEQHTEAGRCEIARNR